MDPTALAESHIPFVDVLYADLLARGIQYFFPAGELTVAGSSSAAAELIFHVRDDTEAELEWLGSRYRLSNIGANRGRAFTGHEQKLLRSIGKVLSARYELLFNTEFAASSYGVFGGLPEDRYISAFLDASVFADARTLATATDRVSEAIEVLRISSLSTYEDRRISTGALLFGAHPDPCHTPPGKPAGALPYSSELTSIRSFHRICDGLRTIALVDRDGLMVELLDVQEWARPFGDAELPVPSARRYQTHSRATLCGGHVCLVLTPNGEIKIFAEGAQVFSFLDGRWRLTDAVEKYRTWVNAVGRPALAEHLFTAALNLAEQRRGGLFVVLDDREMALELVARRDLLQHPSQLPARAGTKNQLHYLLRSQRVTELSPLVLETIARIDGGIVVDRDANLLAFGAILRHNVIPDEEVGEGGRTAAAIGASLFGNALKVSEDGQLSFFQRGHCVWSL